MTEFSPLQRQVLDAMGIPLWQPPQPKIAPLTLVGERQLASSGLVAGVLQTLGIATGDLAVADQPPARGRSWQFSASCSAPRLDGQHLITPPLLQLQSSANKRQLWRLLQQWL